MCFRGGGARPARPPGRAGPEAAGRGGGPARPGWFSPARGGSELAAASRPRGRGARRRYVVRAAAATRRLPGAETGKCRGFRPRHAGAACCRRGRGVELRRGPRAGASRAGDATAAVSRAEGAARLSPGSRCSLPPGTAPSAPPALPHMEPRLRRSPRLPSASRAQAGGGGPQRGVGTSWVTDLFEGGGWGRVGCARTIFL